MLISAGATRRPACAGFALTVKPFVVADGIGDVREIDRVTVIDGLGFCPTACGFFVSLAPHFDLMHRVMDAAIPDAVAEDLDRLAARLRPLGAPRPLLYRSSVQTFVVSAVPP